MKHDDLFQVDKIDKDFVFNDRVAEAFDDMLDRSIPFYRQVVEMTTFLLEKHLKSGDTMFDLGCSTGTILINLAKYFDKDNIAFIGVDNSPAMIRKASQKAEMFSKSESVRFVEEDILKIDCTGAGAIVLNYTLQFIRPLERQLFLQKIYNFLRPGGILVMSEKIICKDPSTNREFIEFYYEYKKAKGYSELEIAKKREALENVLVPFTIAENRTLLRKAGFVAIETFFQWFNFVSFVAVK